MADYEVWLTDDAGARLMPLNNFFFLTYTRATRAFSTCEIGLPYQDIKDKINPVFKPDRRIDIWRSPSPGIPMRREGSYLMRQYRIYSRKEDGVQVLVFYGRSARDLLRRRAVIQYAGTSFTTKTDNIDDMMKQIVRDQMLYNSCKSETGAADNARGWPDGEFSVQGYFGLGPMVTKSFADRNVLEVLEDLEDMSFQLNQVSSSNRRIFFDIVEDQYSGTSSFSYQFQTWADRRGVDRTQGMEFSIENGNMIATEYSLDVSEMFNAINVRGQGRGESRTILMALDSTSIYESRWNRCERIFESSNEPDSATLTNIGYQELAANRAVETIYCTFVNNPGSANTPRSLYGVDWDLGDTLRVSYAGMQFSADVMIIYVTVNDSGGETILGRNTMS